MSDDPRVAFRLVWDRRGLRPGHERATLVRFEGIQNAFGLRVTWELEIPEPVELRAQVDDVHGLDYISNDKDWPVMSLRMLDALCSLGHFAHRRVRVIIRDAASDKSIEGEFVAVQLLEEAVHLDLEHARVERDEDGWIDQVLQWRLETPAGGFPPLFRVAESSYNLFVSAEAKRHLEAIGARGCAFDDLIRLGVPGAGSAGDWDEATDDTSSEEDVSRFTEVELEADLLGELNHAVGIGCWLLNILSDGAYALGKDPTDASAAIKAVRKEIDRYFSTGELPPDMTPTEYEVALGTLWAQCLVNAAGWEIVQMDVEGKDVIAVASPDRRHVVFPIAYVAHLLEERQANSTALLFNMIVAGKLPEAEPGSYMVLH